MKNHIVLTLIKSLPYIFFGLPPACNGVMDILTWRYDQSKFYKWKKEFWNPNYSWMNVKPFLGWVRFDGWHIVKFVMVFFFINAILSCMIFADTIKFYWYSPVILWFLWGACFEIVWRLLLLKGQKVNNLS